MGKNLSFCSPLLVFLLVWARTACDVNPPNIQDYCVLSEGSGIVCNPSLRYGAESKAQAKNISIQCEEDSMIHINDTYSFLMQLPENNHTEQLCPKSRADIDRGNFTFHCSSRDNSTGNSLLRDLQSVCNDRSECEPSPLYYSSAAVHNVTCDTQKLANHSYLPVVIVEYLCLQKSGSGPYSTEPQLITFKHQSSLQQQHTATNFLLQSNDYSHFAKTNWTTKLATADVTLFLAFNVSSTFCQLEVPPLTLAQIGGRHLVFKKVQVRENGTGFRELPDERCQCGIRIQSTSGSYTGTICRENMTLHLPCGKNLQTFHLFTVNELNETVGIIFEIPLSVERGDPLNLTCGFNIGDDPNNENLTPIVLTDSPKITESYPADNQSVVEILPQRPPSEKSSRSKKPDHVFRWDVLLGTLLGVSLLVFCGIMVLLIFRRKRRKLNVKSTRPTSQRISDYGPYDEPEVKDNPIDEENYSIIRISGNQEQRVTNRDNESLTNKTTSEISQGSRQEQSNSNTLPAPPPKRRESRNLLQMLKVTMKIPSKPTEESCADHQVTATKNTGSKSKAKTQETAFVNEALVVNDEHEEGLGVATTDIMVNNEVYDSESVCNRSSKPVSGLFNDPQDTDLYEEMGNVIPIDLDEADEETISEPVNTADEVVHLVNEAINDEAKTEDQVAFTEAEPIVIRIKNSTILSPSLVPAHGDGSSPTGCSILSDIEEEARDENDMDNVVDTTQPSDYFTDDYSEVKRNDGAFVVVNGSRNSEMSSSAIANDAKDGETSHSEGRKDQLTPRLSYTEMVDNDIYNV